MVRVAAPAKAWAEVKIRIGAATAPTHLIERLAAAATALLAGTPREEQRRPPVSAADPALVEGAAAVVADVGVAAEVVVVAAVAAAAGEGGDHDYSNWLTSCRSSARITFGRSFDRLRSECPGAR